MTTETKTPHVGQGATRFAGSDRYAYEVVEVLSPRAILVREMHAIRTDSNGRSEAQTYRFESDQNAPVEHFTLRSNGFWVAKGCSAQNGTKLTLAYQKHYMDPCK